MGESGEQIEVEQPFSETQLENGDKLFLDPSFKEPEWVLAAGSAPGERSVGVLARRAGGFDVVLALKDGPGGGYWATYGEKDMQTHDLRAAAEKDARALSQRLSSSLSQKDFLSRQYDSAQGRYVS